MIKFILDLGLSKVILGDLWYAFLNGLSAWSGSKDAFYYDKSKSLIKKQLKQLNIFQKLFWIYGKEFTNKTKYRKVFYAIRIANAFLVLLYLVLFAFKVNVKIVAIIIVVRIVSINSILFILITISFLKGPSKLGNRAWNLD